MNYTLASFRDLKFCCFCFKKINAKYLQFSCGHRMDIRHKGEIELRVSDCEKIYCPLCTLVYSYNAPSTECHYCHLKDDKPSLKISCGCQSDARLHVECLIYLLAIDNLKCVKCQSGITVANFLENPSVIYNGSEGEYLHDYYVATITNDFIQGNKERDFLKFYRTVKRTNAIIGLYLLEQLALKNGVDITRTSLHASIPVKKSRVNSISYLTTLVQMDAISSIDSQRLKLLSFSDYAHFKPDVIEKVMKYIAKSKEIGNFFSKFPANINNLKGSELVCLLMLGPDFVTTIYAKEDIYKALQTKKISSQVYEKYGWTFEKTEQESPINETYIIEEPSIVTHTVIPIDLNNLPLFLS